MTPKEKAKELINKYATYAVMWAGGVEVERQNCKQCALIAVDQIILEQCKSSELKDPRYQDERIRYWNEVKQEIEKL
jgi:hypothetical protein